MREWPMLALSGVVLSVVGCSSSAQVGLANGPRLGGTGLTDEGAHDAIANGAEACGRHAEHGPLRGHVPPCAVVPTATAASLPALASAERSLVVPWLQHFYVGWPCAHTASAVRSNAVAWASMSPAPAACMMP